MEEVNKTQMELAIRKLRRMAAEIEDVPLFRGIPITDFGFDEEHLVMLCKVFVHEWQNTRMKYLELLQPLLPEDRIQVVLRHLLPATHKPSLWRKIWDRIKGLA